MTKGSPEEEIGIGSTDKYAFLKTLHMLHTPHAYLEIGVQKGRSLNLARYSNIAIGIDPATKIDPRNKQRLFRMTSDEWFEQELYKEFPKPDMILIDGLHLFEQALRDFIHCESISKPGTLILIDDIFPAHPSQADRERHTQKWAGDVWKLYEILKEYRGDLAIEPHDIYPTGMVIVRHPDPTNTILSDHYDEIVNKYMDRPVPNSIVGRYDLLTNDGVS